MTARRQPVTELLDKATEDLRAVDPADTVAALGAAWHGFCVAGAAGELLSICADPQTYPALWDNAQPVLSAAVHALRAAPSLDARLSTEINPAGGPDERLDKQATAAVHRRILDLALALNTALPRAAQAARHPADRRACEQGTLLASELGACYQGRLRSFLSPYRESFGPGSFVVRGQGRRSPARKGSAAEAGVAATSRRPRGG